MSRCRGAPSQLRLSARLLRTLTNIKASSLAAGFDRSYNNWHVAKHDVYGEAFKVAWSNAMDAEVNIEALEQIPQDDDVYDCIERLNNSFSISNYI